MEDGLQKVAEFLNEQIVRLKKLSESIKDDEELFDLKGEYEQAEKREGEDYAKGYIEGLVDGANITGDRVNDLYFSNDFKEVVKPLMIMLAENHHPHTTAIVTCTNAEILEGVKSTGETLDYVKD